MATAGILVSPQNLERFVADIFTAKGMGADDAAVVADVLVWAELRGIPSHGVARLPRYMDAVERGRFNLTARPEMKKLATSAFLLDCGYASGAVTMMRATAEAVKIAETTGIAVGLIRQTTHTGAIGRYAEWAAERGCASIVISVGIPAMAYTGARVPSVATAPIAIGVPGDGRGPIVLDMATATVAMGRIRQALTEGKPIPEGWALDADGNPTVDPAKAETVLPMGGPKGAGLALMFEFLTAALGADLTLSPKRREQNAMVIAINVATFRPLADFVADVGGLADLIKGLPRLDGIDEILLPGERSKRTVSKQRATGIPIGAKTWKQLGMLAQSLGVALPTVQER